MCMNEWAGIWKIFLEERDGSTMPDLENENIQQAHRWTMGSESKQTERDGCDPSAHGFKSHHSPWSNVIKSK